MTWENYYMPSSTEEALSLLDKYQGEARLIAGGTDLMVQHKSEPIKAKALIDIGGIPDLKKIHEENGRVYVGGAVTHSQVVGSPLLKEKGQVLVDAARAVGALQIRNVGTIAGNVVTAQPAADTAIALVALDACVHIQSGSEKLKKPVLDTFLGPGKSSINPSKELITAFSYPTPTSLERTGFIRFARRDSLALPLVNLGFWLILKEDEKTVKDIRIAVGPMSTVPFRARETEASMKDVQISEEALEKAGLVIAEEVTPRDSFRGSADFKKYLIGVALKRAIKGVLDGKGVERDD